MRRSLIVLCVTLLGLLASASAAAAARPLALGFFDGVFAAPAPERTPWLQRTVASGASIIRLQVTWNASRRPAAATDPADPAYDFAATDDAMRAASAQGLRVLVSFSGAPRWAEGAHRPASASPGSWRPDPKAVGDFGAALARRYSGLYPDPANAGQTLPRAAAFQVWNEPNLSGYLSPQWRRANGRLIPASPGIYRAMLNAFYAGVKHVQPRAIVVTAGTSPYGDLRAGGARMQPARFVRELISRTVHFNVLSHHPYSVGGPFRRALNADDVSVPDLGKLTKLLRAGEHAGRILPRGHKRLWVTEFSWDSKPPDPHGVSIKTQARWLAQALYVLWKQGVDTALWFQVRDQAPDPSYDASYQSGIYYRDGRPKPAQRAFAFPFVAMRRGHGRVMIWTRAPTAGSLVLERRIAGRWKSLRSIGVQRGQVVQRVLDLPSAHGLRARAGGLKSPAT